MKTSSLLILLILTPSLFAQNLTKDEFSNKALSENQIAAFQDILVFGETRIGCSQKENSKDKCWVEFLNSSAFDSISGGIEVPWNLIDQNNFIAKINLGEITDSIWVKSWSYNAHTKDTNDYYYLNFNGVIGALYETAANQNNKWAEIWEHIEDGGDIGPSLHAGIFNSEINKLLDDPKMRLLMTLQMMTLMKNE